MGLFSVLTAQTHIWTGNGGDTDWFNANNWNANTVPTAISEVMINGNFVVNIQGNQAEVTNVHIKNEGILVIEGGLEASSLLIIGTDASLEFVNGTISGGGTLVNNGLLKIEGNFTRTFENLTLNNNAQFLITQSNITEVRNTVINNNSTGVLDIASVGGFLQQNTSSVLNNFGVLKKSPDGLNPIGNFYLILEINNEGVIDVQEDQILLLLAGSSTFTNFEGGLIVGNGTYDITTTFINAGTVSPGNSPEIGSLDITNNFSLNSGIIEIDMAGTQPGQFDLISVTGGPSMDGIIAVNLQFAPQLGDEFEVITWNSGGNTCNFPQFITAMFEGFEYTFEINCNANDVTLRVSGISILQIDDLSARTFQFFVQPNPVTQEAAFIFSSEFISSEDTSLSIYNYLGQRVIHIEGFTQENNSFLRGNLPSGLYFAQLETEGKVLATTRMVLD